MSVSMHHPSYRRELGDGLLVRWSTAADLDAIGALYEVVFREKPDSPLNQRMRWWADDAGGGKHPSCGPDQFPIVEDTRNKLIVSALMVLRQTWQYDGIPFAFGRPEAVATHPEYRNRGAVRAIFDLFHARSEARGDLAQGITGIGYFYRQFGYEYAVDLEGVQRIPLASIPKLKDGEIEPYSLRKATADDLPVFKTLYEHELHGTPGYETCVSTVFDEAWWRWVLTDQNPESGQGSNLQLILDQTGMVVGQVMLARLRWGEAVAVFGLSLAPHVSAVQAAPSILRGIQAVGEQMQSWGQNPAALNRIALILGDRHPFYDALSMDMRGRKNPAYAWYVRVPDLPAFMRHITPALERQLASSVAAGYSGELKLDFYRDGMRLVFEQGRLTTIEPWRRPVWGPGAQAGFPPLVFLQLLFRRRSLDDLRYAFPDVWAEGDAELVLPALFPKQRSHAIGQD